MFDDPGDSGEEEVGGDDDFPRHGSVHNNSSILCVDRDWPVNVWKADRIPNEVY
jgi:hypothetical protein